VACAGGTVSAVVVITSEVGSTSTPSGEGQDGKKSLDGENGSGINRLLEQINHKQGGGNQPHHHVGRNQELGVRCVEGREGVVLVVQSGCGARKADEGTGPEEQTERALVAGGGGVDGSVAVLCALLVEAKTSGSSTHTKEGNHDNSSLATGHRVLVWAGWLWGGGGGGGCAVGC